jgi:hypothetical protein
MRYGTNVGSKDTIGRMMILSAMVFLMAPLALGAQATFASDADVTFNPEDVTFSRDIAPILQRSCQNCHNPVGVAPMSLVTYQDARRVARRMKERTAIRDRMRAMPPWYVEKDIGIQQYKQDNSLNDLEVAMIAAWADNGAPEGDPADLPPALEFDDSGEWTIRADLVVSSEEIFVAGGDADWWGEIQSIPIPLEEDRYVSAVQVREVNDVNSTDSGRETVGGRYIVHHMIWRTQVPGTRRVTAWPVHEVGRNPDLFDPGAGRLLTAGSEIASESIHLHSNGRDTRARLEIAFEFHPIGYEPKYRGGITSLANGSDIDIEANQAGQRLDAYTVTQQHTKIISFEPHLHAPGERMCLEAIWGFKAETLSCVGYDHNWVRTYVFQDDYQPLLPKGTILHITGYMNTTEENQNVPDSRNWQGSGNRSVANMFIDLGERVGLTDEQFVEEMAERVEKFNLTKNDYVIGCPLCLATVPTPGAKVDDDSGSQPK